MGKSNQSISKVRPTSVPVEKIKKGIEQKAECSNLQSGVYLSGNLYLMADINYWKVIIFY